jgi:hypothetical protein
VDAACVALWSWNLADDRFAMDERAFDLWGLPWSQSVSFENLSAHIHPADRDRVHAAFTATRSVPGPYEIDFRIMVGDDIRWISARGRAADADAADSAMFGIFLDVTGRKQAEEGSELLAGEMSHRVKNLLAIAAGLTEITSRSGVMPARLTLSPQSNLPPSDFRPIADEPRWVFPRLPLPDAAYHNRFERLRKGWRCTIVERAPGRLDELFAQYELAPASCQGMTFTF